MSPSESIRREFDLLLEKADQWPSHFNLEVLAGYLLSHPEIVGREELPVQKANRLHRERRRQGAA